MTRQPVTPRIYIAGLLNKVSLSSGKYLAAPYPRAPYAFYTSPEGERIQETEWFSVVAWNRLAEQCNQFLAKGRLVYAEGRLHTRNWEGQDGQPHSRVEIVANRVIFLDRRGAGSLGEEKVEEGSVSDLEPEDLPF